MPEVHTAEAEEVEAFIPHPKPPPTGDLVTIWTCEDGTEWEIPGNYDLSNPVEQATLYLTANLALFKARKGLLRVPHFRAIVDAIWHAQCPEPFIWHPWAVRFVEEACCNKYLAVAGCASSGKTRVSAAWAIVNYLAEPSKTLVLVTTTTKTDADQRIWGDIKKLWQAMDPGLQCLGRMVGSLRCIRFQDPYTGKIDEKAGIFTIAGEKASETGESNKLIGKKQKRLILIADELPELSEAVIKAAFGNLAFNDEFQVIGLGNPKSYFDSFGMLAKPEKGWQSINVEMEGWKTEKGYCLHFDGTKSPNIGHNVPLYPIFKQSHLDEQIKNHHGMKSPGFWRMVRGFWCPTGEEDNVYCEADIIKFRCESPVIWATPPTLFGSLDPAFTNGGDDCTFSIIGVGISAETLLKTIALIEQRDLVSDVTNKAQPHAYQIVHQCKAICDERGIEYRNCAYDSTGGGIPFGDVVAREWSPQVLPVNFSGAASEDPVAAFNNTPANERYGNRCTEIWFGAQEYMRSGQIRGLTTGVITQLCSRKYSEVKRAGVAMPVVESKTDMKLRGESSPDHADSLLIGLCAIKERLAFGRVAKPNAPPPRNRNVYGEKTRPRIRGVLPNHFLKR